MRMTKFLAACLGAALALPSAANAQKKLAITGWAPPTHVFTQEIHVKWAEAVKKASNGKFDFEVFMSGALLPPLSTMQGVKDGVAQLGHVATPYHPSDYPIHNLVGDIGHSVGDPLVLVGGLSRLQHQRSRRLQGMAS